MDEKGPARPAPASLSKGPGIANATAAHKHAPSDAYELEDLDEEWVAMLNVLDSRLLEVNLQAGAWLSIVLTPMSCPVDMTYARKHSLDIINGSLTRKHWH